MDESCARDAVFPVRFRGLTSASRTSRGLLLASSLVLTASGCVELEVFPDRIQIPQSALGTGTVTFEARARLRKRKSGDILSDPIQWSVASAPGVGIDPPAGGRNVSVTVPVTATGQFKITVSGKGKTDYLTIDVIAPVGDQAFAKEDVTPSVVAMFGQGPGCPNDSTFAFVGNANLGTWNSNCTPDHVIAFTSYRPPMVWPGPWTNALDRIDATATPGLMQKAVRVWILRNDAVFQYLNLTPPAIADRLQQRKDFADDAISAANGVLLASRVGIRLDRAGGPVELASSADDCAALLHEISFDDDLDGGGVDQWDPTAINVYVMDSFTGNRGEWCWWPNSTIPNHPDNVIRLQDDALMNTLLHEVGHMAGLYVPWGPAFKHTGHVDLFRGFAQDNVMYAGVSTLTTAARTQLSLGQVYRMHFDQRSRLATGSTRNCQCDPYGATCGRLSRDVRPIAKDKGKLDGPSLVCNLP